MANDRITVAFKPSHRPTVLASATITLNSDLGTITIADARVLRNKAGVLWFSLPTFSIAKGREYQYFAVVDLSPALHREVQDAALAGFIEWEKAQAEVGR